MTGPEFTLSTLLLTAVVLALLIVIHAWRRGSLWLVRLLLRLERRRSGLRSFYVQVGDIRFHYLAPYDHQPPTTGDASNPDGPLAENLKNQGTADLPGPSSGLGTHLNPNQRDERPVLLLLHGFGGDCNHWLRIAPFLSRHFRLLIPDLPGFGDTPFPHGRPGNMEAQAERVHLFVTALGIEQCYVGGNSMGAYLAAVYGWLYPEQVRALWLLNPGGVHGAEFTELLETAAGGGHNLLIPETLYDFHQLRGRVFVRQPWLPMPVAKAIVRRCTQRRDLYQQLFDELCYNSTPLDQFSGELTVPVLLVWGDQDHVLHPSGATVLAELLHRGKLVMMPGVGHCPMIEVPRECSQEFIEFVNSTTLALTTSAPAVHH